MIHNQPKLQGVGARAESAFNPVFYENLEENDRSKWQLLSS
jgi:hypothetical protein